MRGDEQRVVDAFCSYLRAEGWDVETGVEWVDAVGRRGEETIYAEVKGRAGPDTGTALDILYGQLLRRMEAEKVPGVRYAVVVPDDAITKAQRVPAWVRDRLRVDLYAVSVDGGVSTLR